MLVTLDTTRADHLGSYGWPHARTPNLDRLARGGTRFSRCDTAAPVTLPSHASILSGLYPFHHGVRDNSGFVLPERVPTLATVLRSQGYDTAAVVSAIVLARHLGLARGFGLYDDDLGGGYDQGTIVAERQAEATTEASLSALSRLRPPFFLWLHYFDPHEEYRPPTRFADALAGPSRLYDGEIAYVDEQLGRVLGALPADTLVVVVGDHGEMLGQHGETAHGLLLNSGARRVPLIIKGPGAPAGKVADALVRTVDIAPTILDLAGVAAPQDLDGRSVLPLLSRSEGGARVSYSESFLPFFEYGWYPLRALSNGDWLFVQAPRPSLYDLRADPSEDRDLASEQVLPTARWKERLREMLAEAGEAPEDTMNPTARTREEERRALASLGYLGGSGGTVSLDLPDPREMTSEQEAINRAGSLIQQNRCRDAAPQLEAILRRSPRSPSVLNMLGQCYVRLGKDEIALTAFQSAKRWAPSSGIPAANAAGCLARLGRRPEAEAACREALALDPSISAAAVQLARLLREQGKGSEAEGVLSRTIDGGGRSAQVYLERGLIAAEDGRLARAEGDFREARRRQPADPVALENLARAVYARGRAREAATLYEQLAKLAPGSADAWKTLGAIYLYELSDRPNAARCFRSALGVEKDPAQRAELLGLLADIER